MKKSASTYGALSRLALLTALLTSSSLYPAFAGAQDQQQQEAKKQEQAKESAKDTPKDNQKDSKELDTEKSEPQKKRLIPQSVVPTLQVQEGPGVGKPLAIIPKPFVPKDSIKLPPEQKKAGSNGQDGDQKQASEQPDPQQVPQNPLDQKSTDPLEMEEGKLQALDPSGMGLLPQGAETAPKNFWQGKSRADIQKGLTLMQGDGGSVTLNAVAEMLLKSAMTLPAPKENSNDIADFIQTRLSLLAQRGDVATIQALLDRLPGDQNWDAFDQVRSKLALAGDKRSTACAIADRQVSTSRNPYWLKLLTFCSAVNGNRDSVDFQISVLEEMKALTPSFFKLIDHILIEAETGSRASFDLVIDKAVSVDLLDMSMMTIAQAKADQLNSETLDPLAIPMTLAVPGISDEAKIGLLEKALPMGTVQTEALLAFLMRYRPSDEDKEAADLYYQRWLLTQKETPSAQSADAASAAAPTFRTLLILAKEGLPAQGKTSDLSALNALWDSVINRGQLNVWLPYFTTIVSQKTASSTTMSVAPIALRVHLLNGDIEKATDWFMLQRQQIAGANQAADRLLVSAYPLMLMAGLDGSFDSAASARWWQLMKGDKDAYDKATLTASLMDATGIPVSEDFWTQIAKGPMILTRPSLSPAQWRQLLKIAATGDSPALLLQATSLTDSAGIHKLPSTLAGSMVYELKKAGFDSLSTRLATEMLILSGL